MGRIAIFVYVTLTSVPYYYFVKFAAPFNLVATVSYCYFQTKFIAID